MISKSQMMELLIAASPAFESYWQQFLDDWRGDAELPLYVALGQYARHLIELHKQRTVESLTRAFNAIERLHYEGDDYVREAATIGILEPLQNLISRDEARAEDVLPYLGAVTRRQWDSLKRFWGTQK